MSFLPFSSNQRNNESAKMIRARMVRSRKSISYNNSTSLRIHEDIRMKNINTNKSLLLELGKSVYDRYYYRVYNSATLTYSEKNDLSLMYQTIFSELSETEEKALGIYQETQEEIDERENQRILALIDNPEYIYYCKVTSVGTIGTMIIQNFRNRNILVPGKKYIFDVQDYSNFGYQLSFSSERFSHIDVNGITFVGTPGYADAYIIYTPPIEITLYSIFVYDKLNQTAQSYSIFGQIYSRFVIDTTYATLVTGRTSTLFIEDPAMICLEPITELRLIGLNGPKFLLESPETDLTGIYSRFRLNRRYGMYFGRYIIQTLDPTNPFTIMNKDKENLIQIQGEVSKQSIHYLTGIGSDEFGNSMDGSYNFYYGNIFIDVLGDFGNVAFYSYKYGFNFMDSLFIFSDKCSSFGGVKSDYDDISSGVVECLYPQTIFNSIVVDGLPYMTFNNASNYDETKVYGLYEGQYMIKSIDEEHPIAFINQGKEDYFTYTGSSSSKLTRLGPDNNVYDYYYGTIVIYVYGDFGNISVYDFYSGYTGGYQLFQYSSVCDFDQTWQPDKDLMTTPSTYDIIEYDLSGQFEKTDISSYTEFIYDNSNIYLQDTSINYTTKYALNLGNYVIMNVPEDYAIAFLNKGLEDRFFYDGYYPYGIQGTGPDGFTYTYYYGNINLYISNDFGQISFYTIHDGFLNGRKKLIFSSDANVGYAIPNNGLNNYFPFLSTSFTTDQRIFKITVNIRTIVFPYDNDLVSYHFNGYDRNGQIDNNEQNPSLYFFLGDKVMFDFQYDNANYTFGIYEYNSILNDSILITNNTNTTNDIITWTPNIALNNYYYYRSTNNVSFMYNTIDIASNIFDDLIPDISSSIPSANEIVSANISEFIFEMTNAVRIDSTKQIHIVNSAGITFESFSSSSLSGTDTSMITFSTGYSNTNRLDFDTSFSIVADEGLFQNIYLNDLDNLTLLDFRTELMHDPSLVSIYPDNNDDVSLNPSDPIILTFDEPVVFLSDSYNIQFYDTSNVSYTSYTSVESSGNQLYIYNTSMNYDTRYQLLIDVGSIVDASNITYDFTDSILNTYYFETALDLRPTIVSTDPSFGQTDVSTNSTISITFNENIFLGTSGEIVIQDMSASSVFDSISISDEVDSSNQLSGMGTSTLIITPSTTFTSDVSYSVLIDPLALQDACGEFFAGIVDDTYYNFTVL